MELTPAMRTDATPPEPQAAAPEPAYNPPPEPTPVYEAPPMPEPTSYAPVQPDAPLMSAQTEALASAALANLSGALSSTTKIENNSLEAIVREMLRPMLRDWMDRNLPTLVERLVEQEIERLARKRF